MTENQTEGFETKLSEPIQRGKSRILNSAFTRKIIPHEAFVDHIGIVKLITEISPEVRGKVSCTCNGGGDPKRAAKMNAEIIASVIESQLKDVLITASDVCKEISTDHMVEVLDWKHLHRLVFGKPITDKMFMVDLIKITLSEKLLGEQTASAVMRAIGDSKMFHGDTPVRLLLAYQKASMEMNRSGKVFTDEDTFGVYTPDELVTYVEIADLFRVIEAAGELNGWVEKEAPKLPESGGLPPGVATPSEFPDPPKVGEGTEGGDDPEMEVSGDEFVIVQNDETDGQTEVFDRSSDPGQPASESKPRRRSRAG